MLIWLPGNIWLETALFSIPSFVTVPRRGRQLFAQQNGNKPNAILPSIRGEDNVDCCEPKRLCICDLHTHKNQRRKTPQIKFEFIIQSFFSKISFGCGIVDVNRFWIYFCSHLSLYAKFEFKNKMIIGLTVTFVWINWISSSEYMKSIDKWLVPNT